MSFNLKNRPKPPSEIAIVTGREPYDYAEKWFEGFEKQLREEIKRQDKMLENVPKKLRAKTHTITIEQILGEGCRFKPKIKEEMKS